MHDFAILLRLAFEKGEEEKEEKKKAKKKQKKRAKGTNAKMLFCQ